MFQRHLLVVAVLLVILAGVTRVDAQTTQTQIGSVANGAPKYYSFTPLVSGQFTATLSWDSQPATLLLVLVCGTSNPLTFGVAAGGLDRTGRLESGVIGLNPCAIGVSTTNLPAAFQLNLQYSANQLATAQSVTLHGVQPLSDSLVDARLREQADLTLAELKARIR